MEKIINKYLNESTQNLVTLPRNLNKMTIKWDE